MNATSIFHGQIKYLPKVTLPMLFKDLLSTKDFRQKTAVIEEDNRYSFDDLNRQSDIICRALSKKLGASVKEPIIGVFQPNSFERIVTILAIWKLGGAFLYLDSVLPTDRISLMLDECKVNIVVTKSSVEWKRASVNTSVSTDLQVHEYSSLVADGEHSRDQDFQSSHATSSQQGPADSDPLVCIIYTSGSTGKPNGVRIRTTNLVNQMLNYQNEFEYLKHEVLVYKISLLWIGSLIELCEGIFTGSTLVLLQPWQTQDVQILLSELCKYSVTRLTIVPTLLRHMLKLNKEFLTTTLTKIRLVTVGGQRIEVDLALDFFDVFPQGCIMVNCYGCSETARDATLEIFTSRNDVESKCINDFLSVGHPIANSCVVILNEKLEQVTEGMQGEICMLGANVADGYVGGGNMSKRKFVDSRTLDWGKYLKDEFQSQSVLYRSGDYGFIAGGRIYYTGRTDGVIKVNGQMVNTDDIANTMKSIDFLESVVVLSCLNSSSNTIPVAFCQRAARDASNHVSYKSVIEECNKRLPRFAIPKILIVDSIPLQPHTKKVDRQALKAAYSSSELAARDSLICLDNEQKNSLDRTEYVFKLAANLLGIPRHELQPEDNFFLLGGDSITAMTFIAHLKVSDAISVGCDISLKEFLLNPQFNSIIHKSVWPANKLIVNDVVKSKNQKYLLLPFSKLSHEECEAAIHVACTSYSERNPIDIITREDPIWAIHYIAANLDSILQDNLSCIIRDQLSNNTVAVGIAADLNTKFVRDPNFICPLHWNIYDAAEQPVHERLREAGGKWIYAYLASVVSSVSDAAALTLMDMLEDDLMKNAIDRGYDGIVAMTTHPVTQNMALYNGYTIENSIHAKSYEIDGQHPLIEVDDNYFIQVVAKRLH